METIKLNDICDVRDGTHDSPLYVTEGYPLVTSKNIIDGQIDITNVNYISAEDYDAINKRSNVDDGDILMPMIGTIGRPVIVNKEFEFAIKNVALIKFHEDSKVMPTYIRYILDSNLFKRYVEKENRGGTQKFISLGNIRSFPVPVVSLDKQKEITTILNNLMQLIKSRKEQIKLLDNLIKSRFVEMFGEYFINQSDSKQLKDICNFIDYRGKTPEKKEIGIPLITAKNVKSNAFYIEPQEFIPADNYEDVMTRGIPQVNDILFTTEAPLGNVCRIPNIYEKFCVGQRLITIQPHKDILNSEYVEMALLSREFQDEMWRHSSGSTVKGIRSKELVLLTIPVPPLDLQNQFATFVQQVDKLKVEAQKSLDEMQVLFDSLMQKYFG